MQRCYHVLVELDIACRDADGTKSNCALRGRGTVVLGAYRETGLMARVVQ
jgi:hypothetical protein